jgi:hypothetical protein
MKEAVHSTEHYTTFGSTLYQAYELSNKEWKLGFTVGLGQSPRRRKVVCGDLLALQAEIRLAKERFGLPEDARVLSCYEAGRDGFPFWRRQRSGRTLKGPSLSPGSGNWRGWIATSTQRWSGRVRSSSSPGVPGGARRP